MNKLQTTGKLLLICLIITLSISVHSQEKEHHLSLHYPDIPGYITLKTDLHQHTVFSDGSVWPDIRVAEAIRENLDVISLTEHLEYQPHQEDIPHPDRNRSYEIAMEVARDQDLLIVHGSEITRNAPMGHSNAIFINDANPLLVKDSVSPFTAARKQGAFIFWNHPAWYDQSPKGNPILSQFQKDRINSDELHGIEVINTFDYAEESLALALEYELTILGTSDIHGIIDWDYTEKGKHRPITLVFSKERSIESLKEALFEGRTVAVYNTLLVGKPEFLLPLIRSSIKLKSASYIPETDILKLELENISSSDLLFENKMDYTFYSSSAVFEIHAHSTYTLMIKTLERKQNITLKLEALGAYTAPKEHPEINWEIEVN
ncbi:MAG: Sb-PDE family phosphodiesterase [Flavobacteriaceae bacterium]